MKLRAQENFSEKSEESFRPPPLEAPHGALQGWEARLRRLFDLQMGSLWSHLEGELEHVTGEVLDAGSGGQPFRSLLKNAANYTGLDTAESLAHFGYASPDTVYYSGDIWPLETASKDFILCTETLEHVLDPRVFLGEAFRVLRPGGKLLLTVPFAARWHFIPFDFWRFTASGLRVLLEQAKFSSIHIVPRGNAVTVACHKTMALFLPFLLPSSHGLRKLLSLGLGALGFPLFLLLAFLGNVSLRFQGGDDCLGYTAIAERSANTEVRG